jgi:4-aminobutyrate aminotransferase/(S)-3-amino-2-methylpropionate transaminase
LRNIAKKNNITFIVDEVQTGCGASGKMWAHEHWNLDTPPDIVTFSKKMQIAGYFTTTKYIPEHSFQIFNTWLGDPLRILLINEIGRIIQDDNLLQKVIDVGEYIMTELIKLEEQLLISNVRGIGTLCAFDVEDSQLLAMKLLNEGVYIGICGENSIRLRPSLTLTKSEGKIFIDKLTNVLTNTN